ncbi:SGNH/GDSL hydrolase family protein [Pseudenhygromyxa sp. WMMC2535]|uniref:SGNH/GDSL hydrolase family protein n=1 Tax=Pseudenhygromyxa sp. WMMC2535 TaxID=2712867 RepID=UPI001557FE51|nr:SGNH/GDSL hydrolase family protein [Pseudenhygromyxa sp. WMMC2535]NVB37958.1 SGNH/GDSL hydrolase family protein [Pseudenhygromyxa sp. WMMC2535]
MSTRRLSKPRLLALGMSFALGLGLATLAPASATANPDEDPPPTWRFKKQDKPVKVVVLAGSVGAWQKDPYHEHLENWCSNVEVENLSKTGYGAYWLRKRFMQQVIQNPYLNLRNPDHEYWMIFHGGLNSVATPESTNKELRQLFISAHRRGVEVVALSLMPWGDESDKKRWRGLAGLKYKQHTETVVDFLLKRSTPQEALGNYIDRRDDQSAPWSPDELADIAIDLYDSDMRDRNAPLRDLAKMRALLEKDKGWNKRHADLDPAAREAALERDAQAAAELPRWYMRPELRAFDHIHPNEKGHELVAEITCPQLPASWGCTCPKP